MDPVSDYMVTAANSTVTLWDIFDPSNPVVVGSYEAGVMVNTVAIRYPFVFVAKRLLAESELLFRLEDFFSDSPTPIEPDFWRPGHSGNPTIDCEKIVGATFSKDGMRLFTGAWTASRMFDVSECVEQ